MTAAGRRNAAEVAEIAVVSCGRDRVVMGLRKASDEFHIRRRQLSDKASMTVSEPQHAERASQNAFLAIGLIANGASVGWSSPWFWSMANPE